MSLVRSLLVVPLCGLLLCGLLVCCAWQQRASSVQSENPNKSGKESTGSLAEQFGDARLLNQLKSEQGIEKPFAWRSRDGEQKGGAVIGIDSKGMLKRLEFVRTDGGYALKPSECIHKQNTPIRNSGDLELEEYLPDTELPFKSFVMPMNKCNVHFIFVWQALNRSFEKRSDEAVFLDAIQLRIIVEKDGVAVSNELHKLFFEDLNQTLAEDVNKDGKPDFLVMGSNRITFVQIWTLEEGCAVKPLLFKEGDRLLESVRDKGLSLSKNKTTGAYDIHVTRYEPITKNDRVYFEVTETVHGWDSTESVYKISKTKTRLESAN